MFQSSDISSSSNSSMQFSHINILTPGLDRDILPLVLKIKKRIKRGYALPANVLAIESINAVSSPPFTISTATNA